mmetsp:Transcript_92473/g.245612  ORF Transcript_92473/g.245612 Transcript_92473/m.245612 type:complete len:242 (+) Transcript_92473:874-1599(+)
MSLKTGVQQVRVAQQASLCTPCHLGAHRDEASIVVLLTSPEVVVDALVVRSFNFVSRKQLLLVLRRLAKVVAVKVLERNALRDDDPVRCFVADIAEVEGGRLHRQGRLEQPVGVDLVELGGLLVHGAAHAVGLCRTFKCEGHLGKELRVKSGVFLLVLNFEEELPAVVASRHFDLLLQDDLRYLVVFRKAAYCVHRERQPVRTHLLERCLVPREIQAVDHPRCMPHVVRLDQTLVDAVPAD